MTKRSLIIIFTVIAIILIVLFQSTKKSTIVKNAQSDNDNLSRGEYLVMIGDCNACHSPKIFSATGPIPDTNRLLSGHPSNAELPEINPDMMGPGKWILFNDHLTAAVGPWGISFAANLTPDKQTGIGLWSEENFITAMRTGKHKGSGRPILPPMPWFNLAKLTDGDIKSIFAYLQSIKPVKNLVPAHITISEITGK